MSSYGLIGSKTCIGCDTSASKTLEIFFLVLKQAPVHCLGPEFLMSQCKMLDLLFLTLSIHSLCQSYINAHTYTCILEMLTLIHLVSEAARISLESLKGITQIPKNKDIEI